MAACELRFTLPAGCNESAHCFRSAIIEVFGAPADCAFSSLSMSVRKVSRAKRRAIDKRGDFFGHASGTSIRIERRLHLDVLGHGADGHVGDLNALLGARSKRRMGDVVLPKRVGAAGVVHQLDQEGRQRFGPRIADVEDRAAAGWLDAQIGQWRLCGERAEWNQQSGRELLHWHASIIALERYTCW
jgi:hypothetical protein